MIVIQNIPERAIKTAYSALVRGTNKLEDELQKMDDTSRQFMQSIVDDGRKAQRELEEWWPEINAGIGVSSEKSKGES
jgi:hypothetical protein